MQYGIVIDAGSSHTDMYFYKWNIPRDRDTGDIEEIRSCGVSSECSRPSTTCTFILPVTTLPISTRRYSEHDTILIYSTAVRIHTCNFNCASMYIVPESLDDYVNHSSKSGELLQSCIADSHKYKYIPKDQWKVTNLYLGATAGMRLLK